MFLENFISYVDALPAISEWAKMRNDYESIEPFFSTNGSFGLNSETCEWILTNSDWDSFHGYLAVQGQELIMICVPVKKGHELHLPKYTFVQFMQVEANITLEEVSTARTVDRVIMGKDLLSESGSEMRQGAAMGTTQITANTAISEIREWSRFGRDWLYQQANSTHNTIPQVIVIPLADIRNNYHVQDVKNCFFALKWVSVFQQMVMTLIVVSTTSSPQSQVMTHTVETNSSDFARPCPPFCRTQKRYGLLPPN